MCGFPNTFGEPSAHGITLCPMVHPHRSGSRSLAQPGAAGSIAPCRRRAIEYTGGALVVALDRHNHVGMMDARFPNAGVLVEPNRFGRLLDRLHREGQGVDCVSSCLLNFLFDAHIRIALHDGDRAVRNVRVVLRPWIADALAAVAAKIGRSVRAIVQLRQDPAIIAQREQAAGARDRVAHMDVSHISAQGRRTYRSIGVDGGADLEFSDGFGDVHTVSSRENVVGGLRGPGDAKLLIKMVQQIGGALIVALWGERCPMYVEWEPRAL